MATANIKCRKSIRRDNISLSANTTEEDISFDKSQEVSNGYESDNTTQDSEQSLLEQLSQTENRISNNRSFDNSGKDLLPKRASSFGRERKDVHKPPSITPESTVVDQPGISRTKCILLFIITVGISTMVWFSKTSHKAKHVCPFSKLQEKYPKEGHYLWNHLQTGSENILNNESDTPAVFLFVHHHHSKQIAEALLNDIAYTSANCFGSSPIIEKISFTSKEAIQDYGHVIEAFKKSIKEENVILIANLNEIPGEAAKALHAICDTVTPLVKKVIILLSLTVNQKNSGEKIIDTAENALRQLWQEKIQRNELDPIITRVTDQVFLLQSN